MVMKTKDIYTFLWADPSEIYASIILRVSSGDKESARKEALRMLAEDLYDCDVKDVEWKIERDAYFGEVEVWKNF